MSLPVILRPEAEKDVESAQVWYDRQQVGLGQVFLNRLADALERLAAMPEIHALVWEDIRFSRVQRFPYVVYYRVLIDRVEVLAVLHGHRDPAVWQGRV